MKYSHFVCVALVTAMALVATGSAAQKPCSTEKVNHENCVFKIDRRFPVTFPTLQMARGTTVEVDLVNPLPYESVTLDETGATLLPGTDQGASLLTSAIPDLKGFTWWSTTLPAPAGTAQNTLTFADPILQAISDHQGIIDQANAQIDQLQGTNGIFDRITAVYSQLNQILSPIPRPQPDKTRWGKVAPRVPDGTPSPWEAYDDWRTYLLCEVDGTGCQPNPCQFARRAASAPPPPAPPSFCNLLGDIGNLQARIPQPPTSGGAGTATPPPPPPGNLIFNQATFDTDVQKIARDISTSTGNSAAESAALLNLQAAETKLVTRLAVLSNLLTNVQKDFLNYDQNIRLAAGTPIYPAAGEGPNAIPNPLTLGIVYDPRNTTGPQPTPYPKFLARQAVFSVNVVNQISTSRASVIATSAKTSIATITVLYADPIFEASAGAVISFLHNRTFSNQTVVAAPAGSQLVAGDIYISETKTRPEVIPFVAGNWRLGEDFPMPDHRRGAVYGTAWLGLNPYNTLPEFGAGLSLSWRQIIISPLYQRGHDIRLTQGETVDQVWCNTGSTAGATPPPCSPAPLAPSTQTFWTNAFGIGLSVRIPTSFAAGTGGVSH